MTARTPRTTCAIARARSFAEPGADVAVQRQDAVGAVDLDALSTGGGVSVQLAEQDRDDPRVGRRRRSRGRRAQGGGLRGARPCGRASSEAAHPEPAAAAATATATAIAEAGPGRLFVCTDSLDRISKLGYGRQRRAWRAARPVRSHGRLRKARSHARAPRLGVAPACEQNPTPERGIGDRGGLLPRSWQHPSPPRSRRSPDRRGRRPRSKATM